MRYVDYVRVTSEMDVFSRRVFRELMVRDGVLGMGTVVFLWKWSLKLGLVYLMAELRCDGKECRAESMR